MPLRKALVRLDVISLYYGNPMQIQSDNGSHFKGKLIDLYCEEHNIEWLYHIPYYPQAAGLIERMNGLLKEKLRKLGNNSYANWKDNLFVALQQLNNRPLGESTPLARMMTPNLQIRKNMTQYFVKWWSLHPRATVPFQGTLGSAGNDLSTIEEIWADPGKQTLCRTGIGIQLPKDHYGQITPRSSLALKGIQIIGGIIDSDYVGEIKVLLHNVSSNTLHFVPGERIAQLLIIPVKRVTWEQISTPPDITTRVGGSGSTDKLQEGAKVWVKRHPTDPPQRGEIIAKGDNNVVAVMIPGNEYPMMLPTNHVFLRE